MEFKSSEVDRFILNRKLIKKKERKKKKHLEILLFYDVEISVVIYSS
jgi:hypothetical protein